MNNARTRRPKVNPKSLSRALQEVKHLLVGAQPRRQVLVGALLAHNQVVAVDARGDGGPRQVARHELQQGHLRRCVLHVGAVGLELQVGVAADVAPAVGVGQQVLLGLVQVRVEDLLGEGEAARAQDAADFGIFVVEGLVGRREGRAGREAASGRGLAAELERAL